MCSPFQCTRPIHNASPSRFGCLSIVNPLNQVNRLMGIALFQLCFRAEKPRWSILPMTKLLLHREVAYVELKCVNFIISTTILLNIYLIVEAAQTRKWQQVEVACGLTLSLVDFLWVHLFTISYPVNLVKLSIACKFKPINFNSW